APAVPIEQHQLCIQKPTTLRTRAMGVLTARGKTLLKARQCRVVLLSAEGAGAHSAAAVRGGDLVAAGSLRCHLPLEGASAELPTLTVKGSGHFSLQCTAATVLTVEAGRPRGRGELCTCMGRRPACLRGCPRVLSWASTGPRWRARAERKG
ncbi:unnamed protein product, partial [Prorocentrum cordatum]